MAKTDTAIGQVLDQSFVTVDGKNFTVLGALIELNQTIPEGDIAKPLVKGLTSALINDQQRLMHAEDCRELGYDPDAREEKHTLVQLRDLFHGLEATAKLLSLHVDLGDLETDLVAYCMSMAREAEPGYMLIGEIVDEA